METKIRILRRDSAGNVIATVEWCLMQMLLLAAAHQGRYLAQEGRLLEGRRAIRIA